MSSSKISNWLLFSESNCSSRKSIQKKKKKSKYLNLVKKFQDEDKELTRSPIAGTYIIKEWNLNDSLKTKNGHKQSKEHQFSKNDVVLNSLAASFVEITPQARAKLEKIPNNIGPYECKLCKFVFNDAFELAMHNCPRVVHLEYKCSECGKTFNCPANLASHKRWHRPKQFKLNDSSTSQKPKLENPKSNSSSSTKFQNNNLVPQQYPAASNSSHSNEWLNQFYSSYYSIIAAAAMAHQNQPNLMTPLSSSWNHQFNSMISNNNNNNNNMTNQNHIKNIFNKYCHYN